MLRSMGNSNDVLAHSRQQRSHQDFVGMSNGSFMNHVQYLKMVDLKLFWQTASPRTALRFMRDANYWIQNLHTIDAAPKLKTIRRNSTQVERRKWNYETTSWVSWNIKSHLSFPPEMLITSEKLLFDMTNRKVFWLTEPLATALPSSTSILHAF